MNPAAALRALRPVKSYTCAHCGRGFTATDSRARYCSNRCRQAVKYQRKTGKLAGPAKSEAAGKLEKGNLCNT